MRIPTVTSEQMAEVDKRVVAEYGIAVVQMMENAARGVADFVRSEVFALRGKRIMCFAGKGNNGGDAIACARHLYNSGAHVKVVLASDAQGMNELSQQQISIVEKMGIPVVYEVQLDEADLIVDGLLGYSIKGDPRGRFAELIDQANTSEVSILSYDIPSGLDPDSGAPNNPTMKATWTVTLALPKVGLLNNESAREYVGQLWLADISVPNELYRDMGYDVQGVFSQASLVRVPYTFSL